MPPRGNTTVTFSASMVEYWKAFYDKHEFELRKRGMPSFNNWLVQLINESLEKLIHEKNIAPFIVLERSDEQIRLIDNRINRIATVSLGNPLKCDIDGEKGCIHTDYVKAETITN